jgi:hypothetical protein
LVIDQDFKSKTLPHPMEKILNNHRILPGALADEITLNINHERRKEKG